MTLQYTVDENDFLTHQLFVASKSDRIKKKRRKSWLIGALYIPVGGLFAYQGNYFGAIIFLILAVLWLIFYPKWERQHYVKHYKSFIAENYKGRTGKNHVLQIGDDFIIGTEGASESKIATSEIQEIYEIPSTTFIKLKDGQAIIMPKDKIADFNALTTRLKNLAEHLNVSYTVDSSWAWK